MAFEQFRRTRKVHLTTNSVKVKCIETGEEWPTVESAAKALGVSPTLVTRCIIRDQLLKGRLLTKER